MSIDAYFIQGLCRELNDETAGARIDKINMPRKDQILLSLRTGCGVKKLMISAGSYPAVWITEEKYENPDTPYSFCMLLRKHFSSGRILSVEQPSHERIVIFTVSAPDEMGDISEKKLIFELIGRQKNLILVNEKGIIFACLRNIPPEGDRRGILPGLTYTLPTPGEKPTLFDISNEELLSICSGIPEKDGDEYLCGKIGGITLFASREAVRSGDPVMFLRRFSETDPEPYVIFKGNDAADVSSFKPTDPALKAESFSKALDILYGVKCRIDNLTANKSGLNKRLTSAKKRIEKKIAEQKAELLCAADRDAVKQKADLITANISVLRKGQRTAEVVDYYDPSLSVKTIELDPLISPQQNAQKLYKKYEKLKNAEKHLAAQIENGENELAYVGTMLYALSIAESVAEVESVKREAAENGFLKKDGKRQKAVKAYPKRFVTENGLTVLCGRNNNENDELTHRIAGKNDLWFHARGVPGSHVVLMIDGCEVKESDISEAASIAAFYSGDKRDKVVVDYTSVKNVKKPSGSRPGAVVYFDYKSVFVKPYSGNEDKQQ